MTLRTSQFTIGKAAVFLLAAFLSVAVAPSPTAAQAAPEEGKIYAVETGREVGLGVVVATGVQSDAVIIGERHGRAAHQNRIAKLVGALGDQEVQKVLLMEMLHSGQQDIIDARVKRAAAYESVAVSKLGVDLKWWETGWPRWSLYRPIVEAAVEGSGMALVAADLPPELLEQLRSDGREAVDFSAMLNPVPDHPAFSVYRSWQASMKTAHCDLIEGEELRKVAEMQWLRDVHMARATAQAVADHGPGIVVAGRAHARADRGIARHLPDDFKVTTIALVELDAEARSIGDYLPEALGEVLPFDFVWVTESSDEEAACDRLRRKGLIGG